MRPSCAFLLALAILPLLANAANVSNSSLSAYLPSVVNAAPASLNSSLSAYLLKYMSNSIVQSSLYFPANVGRNTYTVMQLGGVNRFMVINTTQRYSVLMTAGNISAVLGPFLAGKYYPNQSTLNYLRTSMQSFQSQGAPSVRMCLTETGLDRQTCTLANSCFSCQTVPVCKNLLNNLGGPTTTSAIPLVNGIYNLSSEYQLLNSSYNGYFLLLSRINASNAASTVSQLYSAVSTIANMSVLMQQDTLFPVPSNMSSSLIGVCPNYSGGPGTPWYCMALGFCGPLSFNSTLLSSIQSAILQLQQSPLTSAGLAMVSTNSSGIAQSYVGTVLTAAQNASFRAFLNLTYPQYNATVYKSQQLLGMFSNTLLSNSLQHLQATFSGMIAAGPGQNIVAVNAALANAIMAANTAYTSVYSTFSAAYSLAQTNTYQLAVDELSYVNVPPSLTALSLQQQSINAQMARGINSSQLPGVVSSLQSVGSGLMMFAPVTVASVVKSFDIGVYSLLLSSSASIGANNSSAALYSALISLVIGSVLLFAFYSTTYARLKRKGRLRLHSRAKRAWRALFVVLLLVLAAYVIETYAAANSGNSFLPVGGFLGAVRSSPVTAVMVNTTSSDALACAASVQASIRALGKLSPLITVSNATMLCTSANTTYIGACMGKAVSSIPVVMIGPGNSGIVYRGMYGTVLYASGAVASGSSCPLNILFSR